MTIFILFPGFGNPSSKSWELDYDDKKLIKLDFLKELKKLGKVYCYNPNPYKLFYYTKSDSKFDKHFKEKPTELTLDQFDVKKECEKIYNDLKHYKEDFILIAHSAGSIFAHYFSMMYPKKCKKMILIEGVRLIPKFMKFKSKETYPRISIIKIKELEEQIISKEDNGNEIKKLYDIVAYKYLLYAKKFNGKLKVPTLSFENIRVVENDKEKYSNHNIKYIRDYEEEMERRNGNKIQFINLINTKHFPWRISEYSKLIIKQIKCFI